MSLYKKLKITKRDWAMKLKYSQKKRKNSLETRDVLLIFPFEYETSVVAVQRIHQNSKEGGFYEEVIRENDFEAVLATFCCYDYGANASEAFLESCS